MPAKKTKGSTVSHHDNAARDLRSNATENDNECNELYHMLVALLRISTEWLRVPSPPTDTADNIRLYNSVVEQTTTGVGAAAHSCYLRLLEERGQLNMSTHGCPRCGIRIPEPDIFCGILELFLARSTPWNNCNNARLAEDIRGIHRWEKGRSGELLVVALMPRAHLRSSSISALCHGLDAASS